MWKKQHSLLLTMLRSEEVSDATAKYALNRKTATEILRDAHQPHGLTSILVTLEKPIEKPQSRISKVLREMGSQNLAIPAPIPQTPTSPTPTRKRTTRYSIFPVILPEDFPVSALIRRAHIRRRTRVHAARIRPLPPLPCATASPPSRKPSQRSILSITRDECKVRPLPILPCTIPEGSSEGDCKSSSTGQMGDMWKGGLERHEIASALQLTTDLSALRLDLELEKHDEHFLYDPQLFPRPSTSTKPNISPSTSTKEPPIATSPPISPPSLVTTRPTSASPVRETSGPTTMTRQRRSSAPDHPSLPFSVRPLTHTRSRSTNIKHEPWVDSGSLGLPALRMPHPPSSFRGVGRGVTKEDSALIPAELVQAPSSPNQLRPPSGSPNTTRGENEPANQNKQHGARPRSRVFIDRSVPDTPVSGWFSRGGRAPTPIDWEHLDIILGTKGMARRSYCSVKTLESFESIPRSRKDSNTTIASRSSRSRSRAKTKRRSATPFGFRKISGSRWISFGSEEIPPLPPTGRTWA